MFKRWVIYLLSWLVCIIFYCAYQQWFAWIALLTLLAEVEDTNLLHRGGSEGLQLVQKEAENILRGPASEYVERLRILDQTCIQMNLSPGGCADLLALGLLLYRTKAIWEEDPG